MALRIDALEPVDGKSTVRVRLGEKTLEIGREAAENLGLEPGAAVDADLLGRIEAAADRRSAAARILRYLRGRPRTAREVRDYLTGHGHGAQAVQAVLGELEAKGLVDDERYAAWYVRARRTSRLLGTARIVRELVARGVARETAERATREGGAPGEASSELDRALTAARPRFASAARLGRERGMRRLHGFLMRRGFGEAVVREACLRLFASVPRDGGSALDPEEM
jgi:regulatory protein